MDHFNQIWDNQYQLLIQKISEEEENLKTRQEKELASKLEELENLSQVAKPSMETLNATKILEQAIKRKEYKYCL